MHRDLSLRAPDLSLGTGDLSLHARRLVATHRRLVAMCRAPNSYGSRQCHYGRLPRLAMARAGMGVAFCDCPWLRSFCATSH